MALVGLLFSVWAPACKAFNNLHMTLFSLSYHLLFFFNVLGLIKQFMKDTFWGRLDFLIFGKLRYAVFRSFLLEIN